MPKAAKSSSRRRSLFHRPSAEGKASRYWRIREKLEAMYVLHLLLLLMMCSLTAGLFVIAVQQRIKIQSLEFRLDFIKQRYSTLRNSQMLDIESLENLEDQSQDLTQTESGVQN